MAAVPILYGDARLPGERAAVDAALGSRAPFEPLFPSAAALALASFAAATLLDVLAEAGARAVASATRLVAGLELCALEGASCDRASGCRAAAGATDAIELGFGSMRNLESYGPLSL